MGGENRSASPVAGRNGLVSAKEVACRLGVDPHFVRALARDGRLPSVRVGRLVRFDPRDVEAFIKRNRRPSLP
jgi:excisionase family DNA binding protein